MKSYHFVYTLFLVFIISSTIAVDVLRLKGLTNDVGYAVSSDTSAVNGDYTYTRKCSSQLTTSINDIKEKYRLDRANIGIVVSDRSSGAWTTIYNLATAKAMNPSSYKLFTAATAFSKYGDTYQYSTNFMGSSTKDDLCLDASGDPTITVQQLEDTVKQLANAGYSHLNSLTIDISIFKDATDWNDNWVLDDYYNPSTPTATAFTINRNSVNLKIIAGSTEGSPATIICDDYYLSQILSVNNKVVTVASTEAAQVSALYRYGEVPLLVVGSIPVGSPVVTKTVPIQPVRPIIRQWLQTIFTTNGIAVDNIAYGTCSNEQTNVVATITSPPMSTILTSILSQEDNLYAESVLRLLGSASSNSVSGGISQVNSFLAGVGASGLNMQDGSAISLKSKATVQSLHTGLMGILGKTYAPTLLSYMSVAGRSGVLAGRMAGTPAEGLLSAEISVRPRAGVASAQGVFNNKVAFTVLINNAYPRASKLNDALDELMTLFSELDSTC